MTNQSFIRCSNLIDLKFINNIEFCYNGIDDWSDLMLEMAMNMCICFFINYYKLYV